MMMMRRNMLVAMTAMVVVLFATTHAMGVEWPEGNIPWEISYEADVLPVSVSPPWTMVEHGSVRGGLLTEDGVSFLRIDTLDSGWAQAYFMAPGFRILTGLGAGGGSVATLLGHAGEGIVLTVGSWWCRSREPKASEGAKTTAVG